MRTEWEVNKSQHGCLDLVVLWVVVLPAQALVAGWIRLDPGKAWAPACQDWEEPSPWPLVVEVAAEDKWASPIPPAPLTSPFMEENVLENALELSPCGDDCSSVSAFLPA